MRRIEWSPRIGSGYALVGIGFGLDYLFTLYFNQKESESDKNHLSLQEYVIVASFCSDLSKFSRAFFSDLRESEPKVVIIYNVYLFDNPLISDHGGGTQ